MVKRLLLFILLPLLCYANTESYQCTVTESSDSGLTLLFTLNSYSQKEITREGATYNRLEVTGAAYPHKKGEPDLPQIVIPAWIPVRDNFEVTLSECVITELRTETVIPSQGIRWRTGSAGTEPLSFGPIYDQNSFWPEKIISHTPPYIQSGVTGVNLLISPCKYNPHTETLLLVTEMKIHIRYSSQVERTLPSTLSLKQYKRYTKRFVNPLPKQFREKSGNVEKMLVIAPQNFRDCLTPLILWKNRKGIMTDFVALETIGTTQEAIHQYIKRRYQTEGLHYLLLVGDHQQLPSFLFECPDQSEANWLTQNGFPNASSSDYLYGCVDGDDLYADLSVGRFSGTTVSEIEAQVTKSLLYERSLTPNDNWLDNAFGTFSSAEKTDRKAIDSIKAAFESKGFPSFQTSGSRKVLVQALQDGIGVHVNSSHGTVKSIAGLTTQDVPKLQNQNQYPFNYSLACNPGQFHDDQCLAETMLSQESGGYIGAFMASILQPWDPPYTGIHAITSLFLDDERELHMGPLTSDGVVSVIDRHRTLGEWTAACWVLFGDPSLTLYSKTPQLTPVSHPDTIVIEKNPVVSVEAPTGSLVSLYNKKLNIQSAKRVLTSSVSFSPVLSDTGTLSIVVTRKNGQSYEGKIHAKRESTEIIHSILRREKGFLLMPDGIRFTDRRPDSKPIQISLFSLKGELLGEVASNEKFSYTGSIPFSVISNTRLGKGVYLLRVMSDKQSEAIKIHLK